METASIFTVLITRQKLSSPTSAAPLYKAYVFLNLFECNVLQLYVHIGKFLLFINLVTCRYDLSGVIFSIF